MTEDSLRETMNDLSFIPVTIRQDEISTSSKEMMFLLGLERQQHLVYH